MAYTDKQQRNGATGSVATQNTAVPGPDATGVIAAAKAQAEAAATSHGVDGHAMAGELAGHAVSFEWDAGLAVNDVEGEGSG